MDSPIFDAIVQRREATPIFESISSSFGDWRPDAEAAKAPAASVSRSAAPSGAAPSGVGTATWPLRRPS